MSLRDVHGIKHPKTGETYWSRLVKIDMSKPKDDPTRVETVGGIELVTNPELPPEHPDHVTARVVDAETVIARGRGHCPILAEEVEVQLCQHGYNDLAKCPDCGPYIREGYTRTVLALAHEKSIPLPEAKRMWVAAAAKVGLGEVSASGTGTVTNPPTGGLRGLGVE